MDEGKRIWSLLDFGKHKGRSLPEVLLRDPDYFFWAWESHAFKRNFGLALEASELVYKARHINIPKADPDNWRIKYLRDISGKHCGFQIVPASHPRGSEGLGTHLDLSIVHRSRSYDKMGNRLLLKSFKQYFLGDGRLTKRWCEKFFADPDNFMPSVAKPGPGSSLEEFFASAEGTA
jgi:hypothetical protein